MTTKYVYLFSEGNATMRNLLGGKGANLAEMTALGMPVPQGFTVTTEACTRYYDDGKTIGADIQEQIERVRENLVWTADPDDPNNWTITLSGMQEYDSLGNEIQYYAVERTVVAAGAYDYQAAGYSLGGNSLGTRDDPLEEALREGCVLDLEGEGYSYSG